MEMLLAKVPSYEGTDFGKRMENMRQVFDCDEDAAIPKYIANGSWLSADNKVVPATMEFFLWVHTGVSGASHKSVARGILKCKMLTGKALMQN